MPFKGVHIHKKRGDIIDRLFSAASASPQRIVLPEGIDKRVLIATQYLIKNKLVIPILVGDEKEILKKIIEYKIPLKNVTIVDPKNDKQSYAQKLYESRKEKGMTLDEATQLALDPLWYGTLMVKYGEADGLVCGAYHKTAQTLKAAFTIIKTKPGVQLASSYFIIVQNKKVYFYADCAVNPNPTAEQLAQIAISTADTSRFFGYEPKVAMLSFATHDSAQHELVDKVRVATALAKAQRPEIILDGPLQFDTAVVPDVAARKTPNGIIMGDANVLVFPDLNVGNIAYKITQRFGNGQPIGPIIQGLNKPINDLSIGCTVEEVIETAALTAVQAIQDKATK